MEPAIARRIEKELDERLEYFRSEGKLLEAQRLEQRTRYDIEMLQEIGFCTGIENYTSVLAGLEKGTAPFTLLDYFQKIFCFLLMKAMLLYPKLEVCMVVTFRERKVLLIMDSDYRQLMTTVFKF